MSRTSPRLILTWGAGLLLAGACSSRPALEQKPQVAVPMLGAPGAATTSRDDLAQTIARMEDRLAANATDAGAAVTLADALLRQTRVTGNAALAGRAGRVLERTLAAEPEHHYARRMLAAVQLSQHRFREAIRTAERGLQARRDDAWLQGVLGDAHLELGEYDKAFAAFDAMGRLRPDASAYARASYARELRGDAGGAIELMTMALEATSARDPESLAWHHAQLGYLYLSLDRVPDARREFRHADFVFPGHPFATEGLARAMSAAGEHAAALARVRALQSRSPSPPLFALAGDLLTALGRFDEAETEYRLAEAAWETDAPEPSRFVRFLADRGRRIDAAIRLGERVAAERADIFTADALAWAYFKGGRLDDAQAAIAQALRTGSRNRDIRRHAAAIASSIRERSGRR